ncbi:MAG: DUF87 domain-containing protein [Armatimonas sp.]
MPEYALGRLNRSVSEVTATKPQNIYEDLRVARLSWNWIKLYLEKTGQKRDITAVDSAFSDIALLNAVRPATPALEAARGTGYSLEEDHILVPDDILKRHTLIFGSSGSGKTYFAHILISQQLKAGYSLIAIDPKPETLKRIRWQCEQTGIDPADVILIDPSSPDDVPGFNPLRAGDDPEDIVRLMMEWMKQGESGNAPRMWTFLQNAMVVAVWHGLRPQDILTLLKDKEFLLDTLRQEPIHPVDAIYITAENFFVHEYLNFKESDITTTVNSLQTRFNEMLMNSTFQRMMNAGENSVNVESLFESQQALLISTASTRGMSKSSVNMLVSIILSLLNAAAAKYKGKGSVPVILYMDEVGAQDAAVKEQLSEIANLARERNVRLILAAQHPHQLPESLRRNVMVSSALKMFFHNDGEGAETVASVLASGSATPNKNAAPRLVAVGDPVVVYEGQLFYHSTVMRDGSITALNKNWDNPSLPEKLVVNTESPGEDIKRFAMSDSHAEPGICLDDGNRLAPAIKGLPYGSVYFRWINKKAYILIYLPMMAVYREAESAKNKDYWTGILKGLPPARAITVAGNREPEVIDVYEISLGADASDDWVEASRAFNAAPRYIPERAVIPAKPRGETRMPVAPYTPRGEEDEADERFRV